jgi:hypothetical protein
VRVLGVCFGKKEVFAASLQASVRQFWQQWLASSNNADTCEQAIK